MVPNAGKEKASAEEARRIRTLAMDVGDDPELEQLLEETLLPREMCVR
jgi:saccharopine dehydrogenase-like NADP-dependent oxidoreductase